jgi:ATPase subunit of ABC transporter with duplicated ATPase domains
VQIADGMKVGYLSQEPQLDGEATVEECVMQGVKEAAELLAEYESISGKLGESTNDEETAKLTDRLGELSGLIDERDAWEISNRVTMAMEALRVPPRDQIVKNLSGGEKRRVALCQLLLSAPDILLLDEVITPLSAAAGCSPSASLFSQAVCVLLSFLSLRTILMPSACPGLKRFFTTTAVW